MNRRQFSFVILAGSAIAMRIAHARIQPIEFGTEDFAAVTYRANAEDPIRSVGARVSRWRDPDVAEVHRQVVIANAGSDLPQGEFYRSDLVEQPLADGLATLPATAMTWTTTAGVAAYRTEWAMLTARQGVIFWVLWIGGGETSLVLEFAVALATDLTARNHGAGSDLAEWLPTPDQVPDGMGVELRMSPEGTFDADGTPVPRDDDEEMSRLRST